MSWKQNGKMGFAVTTHKAYTPLWTWAREISLWTATLKGFYKSKTFNRRQLSFSPRQNVPFGIAAVDNVLFWGELDKGFINRRIFRAGVDNGEAQVFLYHLTMGVSNLKELPRSTPCDDQILNPCGENPCSQICLLVQPEGSHLFLWWWPRASPRWSQLLR